MKFSIVGPIYPYRGGIAHYTASLAEALQVNGHNVQVLSFRRQYPTWLYPGKTDRDPSSSALKVNVDYVLDPLLPWYWIQAYRCILNKHPDLTVIQWWTTFWAPAFAMLSTLIRNQNLQIIYLIHNTIPHEPRPWDPMLAKIALQKADAFVIQTEKERERLLALIPKAKTRLCLLPTYPQFSTNLITKVNARKLLQLPEDMPILLFFGFVRPYKGLRHLIEAIAKVSIDQKLLLVVAGEFWEDIAEYQKLITDLKIAEHIRLYNSYVANEEAHMIFSATDVLVAPYIGGTQSAVAGRALAYGLPLIVTELVVNGIDANNAPFLRVVPSGDAEALAVAIREALTQLPLLRVKKRSTTNDWARLVAILEELAKPKGIIQERMNTT